jgi:hypothetical protein
MSFLVRQQEGRERVMVWDKDQKPPADVCPGRYCFHWVTPGGFANMSGRAYASPRDALADRGAWVAFPEGGCSFSRGTCTRLDPASGDRDGYESCGPELERDGLPWFYFYPSAAGLNPRSAARYRRESEALWGGQQADGPGAAPDPSA